MDDGEPGDRAGGGLVAPEVGGLHVQVEGVGGQVPVHLRYLPRQSSTQLTSTVTSKESSEESIRLNGIRASFILKARPSLKVQIRVSSS